MAQKNQAEKKPEIKEANIIEFAVTNRVAVLNGVDAVLQGASDLFNAALGYVALKHQMLEEQKLDSRTIELNRESALIEAQARRVRAELNLLQEQEKLKRMQAPPAPQVPHHTRPPAQPFNAPRLAEPKKAKPPKNPPPVTQAPQATPPVEQQEAKVDK